VARKLRRDYEWAAELVDRDDDIQDVAHFGTLTEAMGWNPLRKTGDKIQHALLVHYVSFSSDCDVDEEAGRSYAYLDDDGRLTNRFEDGARVPDRYIREAVRARTEQVPA
jgi:hypothetical protein